MNLINPDAQIMGDCYKEGNEEVLLKHLELCGRTCYKSEAKMTPESSIKFVKGIMDSKHDSVIEHGAIGIRVMIDSDRVVRGELEELLAKNRIEYTYWPGQNVWLFTANIRSWRSVFSTKLVAINPLLFSLRGICADKFPNLFSEWINFIEYDHHIFQIWKPCDITWKTMREEDLNKHFRFSARFVCNRGVTHELVRHRLASFSQESTRYVNYSKESKGKSINLMMPTFNQHESYEDWAEFGYKVEEYYFNAIKRGEPAQLARAFLPIGVKTEIVVSSTWDHWKWVFHERTSKAAHPEIKVLIGKIKEDIGEIIYS
jgi:thymidylate synthase (FAD)